MRSIKYFFALLLFSSIACAMEEREDGSKVRQELRSSINPQANDEILQSNASNFPEINEEFSGQQVESLNSDQEQGEEVQSKDRKAKSYQISQEESKANDTKTTAENTPCFLLEMLPIEILISIGDCILDENEIRKSIVQRKKLRQDLKNYEKKIAWLGIHSKKEFKQLLNSREPYVQAIKNHLNFAQALAGVQQIESGAESEARFYRIDIRKTKQEYFLFIVKSGINPFGIAKKLKIELTDEEKYNYKKLALEKECKKREIAQYELEEWLCNNGHSDYKMLLFSFVKKPRNKQSYIGVLALLTILDPDDLKRTRGGCLSAILLKAVIHFRDDLVEILLNCGANPDTWDSRCETALDLASNRNFYQLSDKRYEKMKHLIPYHNRTVELLLEAYADPNINLRGQLAIDSARYWGDYEIVELLEAYGSKPASYFRQPCCQM